MQDNLERKQIKNIDFNIDLAQSFGIYKNNAEFDLLDYASSVNISCGFHAGDPLTIRNALLKAKEKNVVVGAHIGFDDIQGFGYRDMDLDADEDSANPELAYLAIIRQVRDNDIALFDKIKKLPKKAKTGRNSTLVSDEATVSFIRKGYLKNFFNESTAHCCG